MRNEEPTPKYVKARVVVSEVGCGLTEQRLRQLRHQRKGPPFVKIGRAVFYDLQAVFAWTKSCTIDPNAN